MLEETAYVICIKKYIRDEKEITCHFFCEMRIDKEKQKLWVL